MKTVSGFKFQIIPRSSQQSKWDTISDTVHDTDKLYAVRGGWESCHEVKMIAAHSSPSSPGSRGRQTQQQKVHKQSYDSFVIKFQIYY